MCQDLETHEVWRSGGDGNSENVFWRRKSRLGVGGVQNGEGEVVEMDEEMEKLGRQTSTSLDLFGNITVSRTSRLTTFSSRAASTSFLTYSHCVAG